MIIFPLFGIIFGMTYCLLTKSAGSSVFMGIIVGTLGAYVGCMLGNILLVTGGLITPNIFSVPIMVVLGFVGISLFNKITYKTT